LAAWEAKVQPEVRAALAGGLAATRVLVELRQPSSLTASTPDIARARAQVAAEQAQVLAGVAPSNIQVIYRYQALPALAARVNERGLAALAAQPEVTRITLDVVGTAADAQSVPLIHADEVQAAGITGAGITVAVLDTGIDTNNIDWRTTSRTRGVSSLRAVVLPARTPPRTITVTGRTLRASSPATARSRR